VTIQPQPDDALPEDRFLNRETSWLAFNERVLELAEDNSLPLLERARFVAIFSTNLDEFFMVRVAGLKRRIAAGVATRSVSGQLPREMLRTTWEYARELMTRQARLFHQDLVPALAKEEIEILRWDQLGADQQERLGAVYAERVFPILTPLAVDPAHPFPYISGLSLNLAVIVRNPATKQEHFARVKVPPSLQRFLPVDEGRFVPLEDVIAHHLSSLFPGMDIVDHHTFRVTRNEDLEVEEDDAENLLHAIERELTRRRFGPPVRLEVEDSIDDRVLDLLMRELDVAAAEVVRLPGPLDLAALQEMVEIDRADLRFAAFLPVTHRDLGEQETAARRDVLGAMRHGDVLLHHPYDSFATSVQAFIEQAAADPNVLAIKQTLYRTSGDSPIVDALIDAADSGKQVLVLVELKARFDEHANIKWARALEHAGCHVVYGLIGLKTHCKLALVVRDESDGLRRYVHIGTGNYNPKTARGYEDLGLLTTDRVIAEGVATLFNELSGFSAGSTYRSLLVAPQTLRSGLVERIEREAANAIAGRPAGIRFKCNAIVDETIIDALYRASQAGVPIGLWARGICALRPGVPGMSETIKVRSVLGRFLEHSRVYEFTAGGAGEILIGSPDLMHRNLDRRVEVLAEVSDPRHRKYLHDLLDMGLSDAYASWHLGPDGTWVRHHLDDANDPLPDIQEHLIRQARLGHDRAVSG
jgi:polyphosphate kinase